MQVGWWESSERGESQVHSEMRKMSGSILHCRSLVQRHGRKDSVPPAALSWLGKDDGYMV